MSRFQLSSQQVNDYHRDGYIIVKEFLAPDEANKLYKIATGDETMGFR